MRANIKLNLYKLVPVALLMLLRNVTKKFIGNLLFTGSPITVVMMTELGDELELSILQAREGSLNAKKHRDLKVYETRNMLRALADYVRMVCGGDADKLSSSGFELSKRREPVVLVGTPQHVVAAAFTPGTVRSRWGAVTGAHFFNVERAFSDPAAGEVEWQLVATTARQTLTITDLKPYQPVWLRVTAIGVNGPGYPSDVVMARAA